MSRLKQKVRQPKKYAQKLANPRTSSLTSWPTQRTSWPTRVGQQVRGPASKVEFGLYVTSSPPSYSTTVASFQHSFYTVSL